MTPVWAGLLLAACGPGVWFMSRARAVTSRAARLALQVLAMLIGLQLLAGLPHFSLLCRGGFEAPLVCRGVPMALAELLNAVSNLMIVALFTLYPALLVVTLAAELWHRGRTP